MKKSIVSLFSGGLVVMMLAGCSEVTDMDTTSTSAVVPVKVDVKDYDRAKTKKKTYYVTKKIKTGTKTKRVQTGTKTSTYRSGGKTKTKRTPVYGTRTVPVYKTVKTPKTKVVKEKEEYDLEVSYNSVTKDFEGVPKDLYNSVKVGSTMHARLTTVKHKNGKVISQHLSDLEK